MKRVKNPFAKKTKAQKVFAYLRRFWPLYLMALPLVVYFAVFNYYPITGLQLAFKDYYVRLGIWGSPWASVNGTVNIFKHFESLFSTSLFTEKLVNTCVFRG